MSVGPREETEGWPGVGRLLMTLLLFLSRSWAGFLSPFWRQIWIFYILLSCIYLSFSDIHLEIFLFNTIFRNTIYSLPTQRVHIFTTVKFLGGDNNLLHALGYWKGCG